jgi:peptide/nickel transport system permease protein
VPWGILEALYRGKWIDRAGGLLTGILLAIPDALLALLLLLLAARTGWFPTGGMVSASPSETGTFANLRDLALHFFLPVVGLALGTVPILVRHVRSSIATVLDAPFIAAARAHGISKWRVIWRHALPAALNPLISLFGFSIGALLSMSLIMEVVLSWPGLGPLVLEAILSRDVYVVMAAVMLSSVFLVAGNVLADVLLYWNDPRVRTVS